MTRDPNPHVAFGLGTHLRLGANLARIEMKVMVQELLARLPDVQVAPGAGAGAHGSTLVRGITSLPIAFTPR